MAVLMLRPPVTGADLRSLAPGEAEKSRAQAAHKICLKIMDGGMSPEERAAADEVVRIFAMDASPRVRQALAETLKSSPALPRETAVRLLGDIDEVALPLLQCSPSLTSDDLIVAARSGSAAKQLAIAQRDPVHAVVVDALVNHAGEPAVAALARNDRADFHPTKMLIALTRFPRSPAVADALISRAFLPPAIAERLVPLVAGEALHRLVRKHPLPPQLAVELAGGRSGRPAIDLLDQVACTRDMRRLVQHIQQAGLLNPSLAVRGLCLGLMTFFEHAMAELAGTPHRKAWVLIHDSGPLGLRAIFERTGAPARLFAPMCAAIEVYEAIELQGLPEDRDYLARMMIERVLSRPIRLSRNETDYLLAKLDQIARGSERGGGGRLGASRSLLSA